VAVSTGEDAPEVVRLRLALRGPMLVDVQPGAALSRLVFYRNGRAAGCGVVTHAS
jgi:hypothetical protein